MKIINKMIHYMGAPHYYQMVKIRYIFYKLENFPLPKRLPSKGVSWSLLLQLKERSGHTHTEGGECGDLGNSPFQQLEISVNSPCSTADLGTVLTHPWSSSVGPSIVESPGDACWRSLSRLLAGPGQ